jgi:hypothetical protein
VEFALSTGSQSICSWSDKNPREPFPFRKESIAIIAKERHRPAAYQATFFKKQASLLQADLASFAAAKVFGIHLRTAFPPISRAPLVVLRPDRPKIGFARNRRPLASSSRVTLDHFVMVRIHARQIVQNQEVTKEIVIRLNLIGAILGPLFEHVC